MDSKIFDKKQYEGAVPSTLCLGCGHDQISRHIVKAFYESSVPPFQIAKISGIGCSSKTPNYFLKQARGFNTIHGRMPSVATGVKIANRKLKVLGISGDGDTGSIGLSGFLHTVRKNIPIIYIVENNGVYGLTKGQFSTTAEKGSSSKRNKENPFQAMNLCLLALSAGCGFIARSFSGDNKQLTQLLKLALLYEGFAFIDVISPCVAYGNEKDFPHSFSSMKEKKSPLHEIDIIVESPAMETEIKEGVKQKIPLPNGGNISLLKIKDHDPTNKEKAQQILENSTKNKELATGLIYYREQANFFKKTGIEQNLIDYKEQDIRLQNKDLNKILKYYK